ncbi:MAG: hypothetical protein EGQ98_00005, partial [Clostridium sp.]|nr:hypothetical protein [Clostridium sp.]
FCKNRFAGFHFAIKSDKWQYQSLNSSPPPLLLMGRQADQDSHPPSPVTMIPGTVALLTTARQMRCLWSLLVI